MTGRTMVAGIGNIFLGDDGFGVEVANRLLAEGGIPDGVRVEDYGIRGVHLAYELMQGYDTAILIDAVPRGEEPGTVFVLKPDMDDERLDRTAFVQAGESPLIDAHGMDPMSVFSLLKTLGGTIDRVLIVGCQPADVSERMGLSEPVAAAVDQAVQAVRDLLREASEMASSLSGGDEEGREGWTDDSADQDRVPARPGGARGHVAARHQEVSAVARDVTRGPARGEVIR